ncbi:MAG: T9SS type A sorting domain-containing protein [Bacteroidales bacterium]
MSRVLNAGAQFAPAAGEAGSTAVYYTDPRIAGWATEVKVLRGYMNIADKSPGFASSGDESYAMGAADNFTVSLGDSGVAVVSFDRPVADIDGFDFAIFENSFDGRFLELAHVDVSSDSIRWVRFPSQSLTPVDVQTDGFGVTDPSMINNLAGKYEKLYGTPFDLHELIDSAGVDIGNILFIKITDVVGSVDSLTGSRDSEGRLINDPWPTPFESSGFDLDAVAIMGTASAIDHAGLSGMRIYPVPAGDIITVCSESYNTGTITIISLSGKVMLAAAVNGYSDNVDVSRLPPGTYIMKLSLPQQEISQLFIKR